MQYPLISEYIDAIRNAEDNFDKLSNLRPVLDTEGDPIMSSGNFAVIFKMTDGEKFYAIKCFTREQEGREKAYQLINEELKNIDSPYLVKLSFYSNELFVDSSQTQDEEFPVVCMDWVEGKTMSNYVKDIIGDEYALKMLAFRFACLSKWLLKQPFAHGDIKPDNILVQPNGTLTLVDYDGMYVPSMKGENAREVGSPNFCHPLRDIKTFNEHIDDFSLLVIALSLQVIIAKPDILKKSNSSEFSLFSKKDFLNPATSHIVNEISALCYNKYIGGLLGLFYQVIHSGIIQEQSRIFLSYPRPFNYNDTQVYDLDKAEGTLDKYGCLYTNDGLILLECKNKSIESCEIKLGTICIADYAFRGCSKLIAITLPEGLSAIGECAFQYCRNLSSIYMPEGLKSIGTAAFDDCNNLLNIDLPSSLCHIGDNPFLNCTASKEITIKDNDYFFIVDHFLIEDFSLRDQGDRLLSYFGNEPTVNIPDDINRIGAYAFGGNDSISTIILDDWVDTIEDSAFNACQNLSTIKLSPYLTSIGDSVFAFNESLVRLDIPNGVVSIGECCFFNCKKLEVINFPSSLCVIANVDLHDVGEKNISNYFFFGDNSLKAILVENNEIQFYKYIFQSYQDIIQTKEIYEQSCLSNKDVNTIKGFYSADGKVLCRVLNLSIESCVRVLYIKEGTTCIEENAFANCNCDLDCIVLPRSLEIIEKNALSNVAIQKIISFSDHFIMEDSILYNEYYSRIVKCESARRKSILSIPESVTFVDNNAFKNVHCGFVLLDSYVAISPDFEFPTITCKKSKVDKEYYDVVGNYIGTSYLIPQLIEDEFGGVYSADKKIFYYFPYNSDLKYYKIDDDCEIIKSNAFSYYIDPDDDGVLIYGNKVETLEIPRSVLSIEEDALYGCNHLLNIIIDASYKQKFIELLSVYKEHSCPREASYFIDKLVINTKSDFLSGDDTFTDEYGITYSKDGLLLVNGNDIKKYSVRKGTLAICDGAFYLRDIENISLPEGLISIGKDSFCDTGIENITIPQTVKYIGDMAFCGEALKTIDILGKITYMGSQVFSPDDNGNSLESVKMFNCINLGNLIFEGCYMLNSILMPKSISTIGINPFAKCGLKNIDRISNGLEIDDGLIYTSGYPKILIGNTNVSGVIKIKDGTEIIGACAFEGNSEVSEIYLPKSIKEIRISAFQGCRSLQIVHLNNGLMEIGDYVFNGCQNINRLILPNSILRIGKGAFYGCKFKNITLPKYLLSLGDVAFEYSQISNIVSESPLFEVFDGCLYSIINKQLLYCPTHKSSITIKEGTLSIAKWAVRDCSNITQIVVPNTVCIIGECAFWGCSSLENIILSRNLEAIGSSLFEGCKNIEKIVVYQNSTIVNSLYSEKELRNKIEIISKTTLLPSDKHFVDHGGWATYDIDEYSQDGKRYLNCPSLSVADNQIKEGVEIICDDSFNSLYSEIDGYYLGYCNLVIPSTVKYIGKNVFDGAPASIINKSPYFVIDNDMLLSRDKKVLYRYFGEKQDVIVPDFVEEIIGGAFSSMQITSIVIPSSVRIIGDNPVVNNIIYKDDISIPCKVISQSDKFSTIGDILVDNEQQHLIAYFGEKLDYRIPNGIKSIGNNAFFGTSVKNVYIPNSIECIAETAFYWCFRLEHIYIPKGTKYSFSKLIPNYLENNIIELDS